MKKKFMAILVDVFKVPYPKVKMYKIDNALMHNVPMIKPLG